MILSINKNYISFVLIFDFSLLTEKPVATRDSVGAMGRVAVSEPTSI
jgi:hypothetical protein